MSSKLSDKNCELCYPANEETKQILVSLIQSLYKLQEEEKSGEPPIDNGGFNGLLKMIFYLKYKNHKDTLKCSHEKARQYISFYSVIS